MAAKELNRWFPIGPIPERIWNRFDQQGQNWLTFFFREYLAAVAGYCFQKQAVTVTDELFGPPMLGIVLTGQVPPRRLILMQKALSGLIDHLSWNDLVPYRVGQVVTREMVPSGTSDEGLILPPTPFLLQSIHWHGSVIDGWPDVWARLWVAYFSLLANELPQVTFRWKVVILYRELSTGLAEPGLGLAVEDERVFEGEFNELVFRLNLIIDWIRVQTGGDQLNPAVMLGHQWPGRP